MQGWYLPGNTTAEIIMDYGFEDEFNSSSCSGPFLPLLMHGPASRVDLSALSDQCSTQTTHDGSGNNLEGTFLNAGAVRGTEGFYGSRDEIMPNSTAGPFKHGDFYYDREGGAVWIAITLNHSVQYSIATCPDYGCPAPEQEKAYVPGARSFAWSSNSSWAEGETDATTGEYLQGYQMWRKDDSEETIKSSDPLSTAPVVNDSITIPADWEVLLDTATPVLNRLDIYGTLRCPTSTEGGDSTVAALSALQIVIWNGGKLTCGSATEPFTGSFTLTVHGDPTLKGEETFESNGNIEVHNKWIVAWGELTLVGKAPQVTWTRLTASLNPGDTVVTVEDVDVGLDWLGNQGWEVFITSSSHDQYETEKRELQAVSGNTLTLASPVDYFHQGEIWRPGEGASDWTPGAPTTMDMRAAVGLLHRNIVVQGGDLPEYDHTAIGNQAAQEHGAKIICGALLEEKAGWNWQVQGYLQKGFNHHKGVCYFKAVEFRYMGGSSGDCALYWTNEGDPAGPYPSDALTVCQPAIRAMWPFRGISEASLNRYPQLKYLQHTGTGLAHPAISAKLARRVGFDFSPAPPLNPPSQGLQSCKATLPIAPPAWLLYQRCMISSASAPHRRCMQGQGSPLHVLSCSFHDLYNAPIYHFHIEEYSADSLNWLHAIDNVAYKFKGRGIFDAYGVKTRESAYPSYPELQGEVTRNLFAFQTNPSANGAWLEGGMAANSFYEMVPTFHLAYVKYLRDNYCIGQCMGTCFRIVPGVIQYGNHAMAALYGFLYDETLHPGDGTGLVENVTAWKCSRHGVLVEHRGNLHVRHVAVADCKTSGVYTHTTEATSLHLISDSLIAGKVPSSVRSSALCSAALREHVPHPQHYLGSI
ncbi:hypothetical protein CYMTET_6949 [Cymbomonas tetramitiformis]|uniref:G8 domain-containing protein n=1 Tax=Cymbomonas tetramitiformis TaxID=36881 RepID=A0AAE0GWG0_9CHLO|nr:hypothetical protein CYMTET_6949 [Cymbomonas tetramitiformis]